ncbi:MAG: UDP-N-acetylmuramoyl-L-alanine--D-glutamate ligase [Gammaproteobacteria bacterium]|nr:UDP-N-acetylmuramoyl-L-alanine--D-glutamate ligase [Gammaproteobacteria bacterium]
MDWSELEQSRIAILGTGREGQAAWRFLRARLPGRELILIDEAEPPVAFCGELTRKDRLRVGPLAGAGLESFDLLVRSPGISPYRESLLKARESGVRITSPSNLWFAGHPEAPTICISGTKGKSTTSALTAHLLSAAGLRVQLAGNIGWPLLDCDDRDVDWWVIELSSYQLADLEARPRVAVLLNLSPEHLDWHGGEARYRSDKLRLAELSAGNLLIANAADGGLCEALGGYDVRWFNAPGAICAAKGRLLEKDKVCFDGELPGLPGDHNLSNAAAALTVVRAVGADFRAALAALPGFEALPHRLQRIGERDGRRYVNDSISSTPVATAAALEALAGETVTLIAGGLDRGVDWAPYMPRFRAALPGAVITLPDNGDRICDALASAGIEPPRGVHAAEDLAGAVSLAESITPAGGIVLLSPGAPSFPQFRDYRDRGDQFAKLCGVEAAHKSGAKPAESEGKK